MGGGGLFTATLIHSGDSPFAKALLLVTAQDGPTCSAPSRGSRGGAIQTQPSLAHGDPTPSWNFLPVRPSRHWWSSFRRGFQNFTGSPPTRNSLPVASTQPQEGMEWLQEALRPQDCSIQHPQPAQPPDLHPRPAPNILEDTSVGKPGSRDSAAACLTPVGHCRRLSAQTTALACSSSHA